MHNWLTIELVLATLLVTTFTCVGLLALWAATSPRHWFVRTGVVLLAFSPLLLVPAYGPFLTFLLAICFVVGGVAAYRRWRERKLNGSGGDQLRKHSRWQFSVKSVLALCTCVAVLAAIAVKIPAETWGAWDVITIAALIAAAITLVAAWIVAGQGTRRERIACAFTFPFVLIGGAVISMRYADLQLPLVGEALAAYVDITENGAALLLAIAVGMFAALVLTLLLFFAGFRHGSQPRPTSRWTAWARIAMVTWTFSLAAFPLFVLAALLRPLQEPDNTLPVPNGYDELVRIGKGFQNSAIMKELAADVVDEKKLAAAIATYGSQFANLRQALRFPSQIPVKYDTADASPSDAFWAFSNLKHVLAAKADATFRTGNLEESLACQRDLLHLAKCENRNGLLINFLHSSATEGIAAAGIHQAMSSLRSDQCESALDVVREYDAQREEFERIIEREKVWISKTSGWPGRLGLLLEEVAGDGTSFDNVKMCRLQIYPRDQTVARLLIVELAIRAYQFDRGQLPTKLDALLPQYLPELPLDPFATGPQPLHYLATDNGFVLWSVGPDGVDNDGKPLPKNEYGGNDLDGYGDIRLDRFFAPIA